MVRSFGHPVLGTALARARRGVRDAATLRVARAAGRRRGARISAAEALRTTPRAVLASQHRPGLPAAARPRAAQVDRPARRAAGHPLPPPISSDRSRRARASPLAGPPSELAPTDP